MDHASLARWVLHSYSNSTHSVNEIEFFKVNYAECTLIAFRGTEVGHGKSFTECLRDKWDIVRDVRITPWKVKGIPVGQAGFIRGAGAVLNELRAEGLSTKPYVLVGHSMGGAIAIALWAFLEQLRCEVQEVVTFGCPKVFYKGKTFRSTSNAKVTMYRNGNDPVTQVFLGTHPVRLTAIGRKRLLWDFSDHSMQNYIKELECL